MTVVTQLIQRTDIRWDEWSTWDAHGIYYATRKRPVSKQEDEAGLQMTLHATTPELRAARVRAQQELEDRFKAQNPTAGQE
jgi:hypothetical protein